MAKFKAKWEIAYLAKKLRKERAITVSCLPNETGSVIEMLSSFSNSNPILKQTIFRQNSREVFLEIVNP